MNFDPVLYVMPTLSTVDLLTLAGDAVYTRCFQAKVILMFELHPVSVLKVGPTKVKKATSIGSSVGSVGGLKALKNPSF
jgi:hypothetical protein